MDVKLIEKHIINLDDFTRAKLIGQCMDEFLEKRDVADEFGGILEQFIAVTRGYTI